MSTFEIFLPPFVLSLSLILIHAYFGLKIFERGIIFSDIAVAQASALGIAFAFLIGAEDRSYVIGVLFASLVGLLFSATRMLSIELKESFVGIIYALAGATTIIILSKMPEHEVHSVSGMLLGNIIFVNWNDVIEGTALYLLVGVIHIALRKKLDGRTMVGEFIFYLTFGLVVSSSVRTGGVLLVFSYLVAPAFCSNLFFEKFTTKLTFGWLFGIITNLVGFLVSINLDLPTAPSVISLLGIASIISFFIAVRRRKIK